MSVDLTYITEKTSHKLCIVVVPTTESNSNTFADADSAEDHVQAGLRIHPRLHADVCTQCFTESQMQETSAHLGVLLEFWNTE